MSASVVQRAGGSASSSSSSSSSSTKTGVSIVIPTYKEVLNIPLVAERIFQVLRSHPEFDAEVVIVDDNSNDGSVEAVAELQRKGHDITIMVRKTERGLSSAVLEGFRVAKHDVLLVMDADLQHPPTKIPELLQPVIKGTADFTLGSRHVSGGEIADWSLRRKIISWGATMLAKPLVSCSDPMSGFFCLRRETLKRATVLNPMGYKIALELMVRCRCTRVLEVPITFNDREHGESKLTASVYVNFLLHVANLYIVAQPKLTVLILLGALVLVILLVKRFLL